MSFFIIIKPNKFFMFHIIILYYRFAKHDSRYMKVSVARQTSCMYSTARKYFTRHSQHSNLVPWMFLMSSSTLVPLFSTLPAFINSFQMKVVVDLEKQIVSYDILCRQKSYC